MKTNSADVHVLELNEHIAFSTTVAAKHRTYGERGASAPGDRMPEQ